MGDSFLSSYNGVSTNFRKCMDQADPTWRKISTKDIAADSDWFVPAEEVFVDDIIENVTVGCVNRKIQRDHERRSVDLERIKRESILAIKELSLNPPTILKEVLKKNVNFARV